MYKIDVIKSVHVAYHIGFQMMKFRPVFTIWKHENNLPYDSTKIRYTIMIRS